MIIKIKILISNNYYVKIVNNKKHCSNAQMTKENKRRESVNLNTLIYKPSIYLWILEYVI